MIQDLWHLFCRMLVQFAALLYYRPRYFGVPNVPAKGGCLVVSNHQSHLDPPLVGIGCPRIMAYLARKTLFSNPVFARLIASLSAIPIDRDGFSIGGIKESLRRLKRGEMLLIFPEGTRTPDGEIQPFRPGFTTLAARAGVPIMPVAIEGAYHAWPRSTRFPRPAPVHVCFGKPIPAEVVRDCDERELLAEIERRVRQCQQQLRAHPAFRQTRIAGKASVKKALPSAPRAALLGGR